MSKTPVRRLKVFQAPFGFYDTIVAVPSRAAALRAWGTRQDLFAFGQAHEVDNPESIAAALSQPGVVLKRAIGTNAPVAKEATSLPILPDAPKPKVVKAASKQTAPPRPRAQPPDRGALTRAETSLGAIDKARKAEEAEFHRQQEERDAARAAAQAVYVQRRKAATSAVVAARKAYRKAGGTD